MGPHREDARHPVLEHCRERRAVTKTRIDPIHPDASALRRVRIRGAQSVRDAEQMFDALVQRFQFGQRLALTILTNGPGTGVGGQRKQSNLCLGFDAPGVEQRDYCARQLAAITEVRLLHKENPESNRWSTTRRLFTVDGQDVSTASRELPTHEIIAGILSPAGRLSSRSTDDSK